MYNTDVFSASKCTKLTYQHLKILMNIEIARLILLLVVFSFHINCLVSNCIIKLFTILLNIK